VASEAAPLSGRAPAVFLHGQPGEASDWDRVTAALRGRVRTIAVDRPGYGRTGGAAVGVSENADAVVDLLDRLRIDQAVVVAHSWGGAVALDLALRYQERVAGLVLVASVGGEGSLDELDRVLTLPIIGPVLSLAGMGLLRTPAVRRALARAAQLARVGVPVEPDLLSEHTTPWPSAWRSFVVEQRALIAELPALTAALGRVTTPAAVVIGELDRVVRPAAQESLAARLAAARAVRIADVGHLVPVQRPEAVAEAVESLSGPGTVGAVGGESPESRRVGGESATGGGEGPERGAGGGGAAGRGGAG
jgi:pimeloyl-ACP methyl ester carboxylesterase